MNLEERKQIEEKLEYLNAKLIELGIPQLQFYLDVEGDVVQLLYKLNSCNFYEWVGSVVDSTPSEILDWLEVQETQLYLYKQLITYFGDGFAHAIIPNDSTVTLTLKHLTYVFSYDREHLVVFAYKNYIGKDLAKHGSKVGELTLQRIGIPHSREVLGTKVSITKVGHETDVVENLEYVINTFKRFEDLVVNQTN